MAPGGSGLNACLQRACRLWHSAADLASSLCKIGCEAGSRMLLWSGMWVSAQLRALAPRSSDPQPEAGDRGGLCDRPLSRLAAFQDRSATEADMTGSTPRITVRYGGCAHGCGDR